MESNETKADKDDNPMRDRILTIPNVICFARLIGALSLIYFAIANMTLIFTVVFVSLSLSDWIDGRLARWLHQRSEFGARLDSFADSVLYGSLLFGMIWLRWEVLQHEALWWIMGLCSYALTTGAGLWKYGRIPSYHTHGAKITQWLVLFGAVCLLLDFSTWPFRIAMLAGTLTNLEAAAITRILPKWRADVLSISQARVIESGGDHQGLGNSASQLEVTSIETELGKRMGQKNNLSNLLNELDTANAKTIQDPTT